MLNNQLFKNMLSLTLSGLGIASISAIIYLIGPQIEIGGTYPLRQPIVRDLTILVLVSAFASFRGFKFWQKKKKAGILAKVLSDKDGVESDADTLADRMKDALATLKKSSKGTADFMYDLPWYVIIGPPGSGKTTALVHSGLKFPLSAGATPAAIAGVGGTRYCDWWFTEDAVLIDTAGRYTTQDSDAKSDQTSWFAFLDLLKKNRPRQPINGVLVAISLQDMLTLSEAEIAAHAKAIRSRLLDLHSRLQIDFPVYALFTKSDLVSGFVDYFGNLNEAGRRQVWGATFQTSEKDKNMVAGVPDEFDALIERLNLEMPDRLQEEPTPGTRVALYGFPAQMAKLKMPLFNFLNQIFEPTRYHANAVLRGFYFTSGTQQGSPIDQLIVALTKNFGAENLDAPPHQGQGKSYFLTDLIQKTIIGEAAWVSTDPKAVRRQRIIKGAAFAAIAVVAIAFAAAWWTSYRGNDALIASSQTADGQYTSVAGNVLKENVVSDRNLTRILEPLERMRYAPAGYADRNTSVPIGQTFGLSQRDRLESASVQSYHVALERLLRPRLLFRLEELLDQRKDDPSFIYEALKVYMMLGGLHKVDPALVTDWERRDWAQNLYPDPSMESGRKALEGHLSAMLDLDNGTPHLVETSSTIVEDAQKTLARLTVAQRAYELLKSQARSGIGLTDWNAKAAGGLDADRVFEAKGGGSLDQIRIPGFYTYVGFQRGFMERLGTVAAQVNNERWVLGTFAEQNAVASQYDRLPSDLSDLYVKDYIQAWNDALNKLQMKPLVADKPRYLVLGAVAVPTSPLRMLFESLRDETALTKERPGLQKPPTPAPAPGQPPVATPILYNQADIGNPAGRIEQAFRPFHEFVEGTSTQRPIDLLIAKLGEIKDNLLTSANVPSQAGVANAALQVQVQNFRAQANRLPPPFGEMMTRAASSFDGDVTSSELAQLQRALGDQVIGVCQQMTREKYPLTRGASSEISLSDFGRVFAPNGVMDGFFKQSLAKYADTSRANWSWRTDQPVGTRLSAGTLRSFQQAAQIRDAFFPTGGTSPNFTMQVLPPTIQFPGTVAKFEVNGATISTPGGPPPQPGVIQWPGAQTGHASVTLTADPLPPGSAPVSFERTGAWSLFRLLDAGGAAPRGDRVVATWSIGGQFLSYTLAVGGASNPLTLPALREFRCPTGL